MNVLSAAILASGLLFLGGCPNKGGTPVTPVPSDGATTTTTTPSCEALEDKVSKLYEEAAKRDGVAADLQSEFVADSLKMVMNDCHLSPVVRGECLQKSQHCGSDRGRVS